MRQFYVLNYALCFPGISLPSIKVSRRYLMRRHMKINAKRLFLTEDNGKHNENNES